MLAVPVLSGINHGMHVEPCCGICEGPGYDWLMIPALLQLCPLGKSPVHACHNSQEPEIRKKNYQLVLPHFTTVNILHIEHFFFVMLCTLQKNPIIIIIIIIIIRHLNSSTSTPRLG